MKTILTNRMPRVGERIIILGSSCLDPTIFAWGHGSNNTKKFTIEYLLEVIKVDNNKFTVDFSKTKLNRSLPYNIWWSHDKQNNDKLDNSLKIVIDCTVCNKLSERINRKRYNRNNK